MTADDPVLRAALTDEVLRDAISAYYLRSKGEDGLALARDALVAALTGRPEAGTCSNCSQWARSGSKAIGSCFEPNLTEYNIHGVMTDEDFGCNLYKALEATDAEK